MLMTTKNYPLTWEKTQYSFVHSPAFPEVGQSLQFTGSFRDLVVSWGWDFGNGILATGRHPPPKTRPMPIKPR